MPVQPRRRWRRSAKNHAPRAHRSGLALLSAGRSPGAVLRLSRLRAVRSGKRQSVQSGQTPHRPVRQGDHRYDPVEQRALRVQGWQPRRGPRTRSGQQRGRRAEVRRRRSGVHLGRRSPATHSVESHDHLRMPRQRDDKAAPRRAREFARHVSRSVQRSDDRILPRARSYRTRTAARASVRRRPPLGSTRAHELLGIQLDRLFRSRRALRRQRTRQPGVRVQEYGEDLSCRRHRGDPRRGVQPHW